MNLNVIDLVSCSITRGGYGKFGVYLKEIVCSRCLKKTLNWVKYHNANYCLACDKEWNRLFGAKKNED